MAAIEPMLSKSNYWTRLLPGQLGQGGCQHSSDTRKVKIWVGSTESNWHSEVTLFVIKLPVILILPKLQQYWLQWLILLLLNRALFPRDSRIFFNMTKFLRAYFSHTFKVHHHASLLNSSIKQVNCVGGMEGIEPMQSKSNDWTPLSPCQLGQGGCTPSKFKYVD